MCTSLIRLPARPISHVPFAPHQPPPSKWRPKNTAIHLKPTYNLSQRPAAMAHNQFIHHPKTSPQKHMMPSRYAKPNRTVVTQQLKPNTNSNNQSDFFANRVVEVKIDNNNKCSALKNTKMRIGKKMNEITMDSDGSSSLSSFSDHSSPNRETQKWSQTAVNGLDAVVDDDEALVSIVFVMCSVSNCL